MSDDCTTLKVITEEGNLISNEEEEEMKRVAEKFRNSLAGVLGIPIAMLLAAHLLGGCVKQKVVIKVKPDGSGKIALTRTYSKEGTAMLEQQMNEMKKQMAANPQPYGLSMVDQDPFYNEGMLKMEAAQYGDDVEFVSGKKTESPSGKGCIAVYKFSDINKLTIPLGNSIGVPSGMPGGGVDSISFKFEKKGDLGFLKIIVPQGEKTVAEKVEKKEDKTPAKQENAELPASSTADAASSEQMTSEEKKMFKQQMDAVGNPFGFTGNESEDEITMKMFKGFGLSLAVEVESDIVKSDASYPDAKKKNRFTLYDIDFDTMMKDPGFLKDMRTGGGGMEAMMRSSPMSYSGKPGVVCEPKEEISVEFK